MTELIMDGVLDVVFLFPDDSMVVSDIAETPAVESVLRKYCVTTKPCEL